MIWFNILLSLVIIIFSFELIGEPNMERKKIYQPVLMLSIAVFAFLIFIQWSY